MSDLATRTKMAPVADDVIAILRAHEAEPRAAGIKRLSLFGSVAPGDARPDNDINLAAELDRAARIGLFRLVGLEERIGDLIGRGVDLLSEPHERFGRHHRRTRFTAAGLLPRLVQNPAL